MDGESMVVVVSPIMVLMKDQVLTIEARKV